MSFIAIATDDIPAAVNSGGKRKPGIGNINGGELAGREIENWSLMQIKAGSVLYIGEATRDGVQVLAVVNAF